MIPTPLSPRRRRFAAAPLLSSAPTLALGVLLPLVLGACVLAEATDRAQTPRADLFLDHVAVLAADDMEGRDTGSAGNEAAAAYVAQAFALIGLEPAGRDGTWMQPFDVVVGRRPGPGTTLEAGDFRGTLGGDFRPSVFSIDGTAEGPLLVLDGELPADPHGGGPDVAGKVLLVREAAAGTAAPDALDAPDAPDAIARRVADPHAAERLRVLEAAFARDARAVVFVISGDALEDAGDRAAVQVSLPAVVATRSAGDALEAAARSGRAARIALASEPITAPAKNVAAWLPPAGGGPATRHVIIGAHLDHVGRGGDTRSRGKAGEIHNGADDNASGIAALLEIARVLQQDPLDGAGVLFLAFNGEEMGLLGSQHYVKEPLRPLDEALVMLNLDMVGRALRPSPEDASHRYLSVGGGGTAASLGEIVAAAHDALDDPFELDLDTGIFNGSSDHIPFYVAKRPVLFFFTGLHDEYHTDRDDVERIDAEGGALVAAFAAEVARRVAALEEPPAFVQVEDPGTAARALASPGRQVDPRTGSAYGAYLGTIPDFAGGGDGVLLSGVQPGSPAEKGGLRGGDRMIRFDGKEVKTLKDYAILLRTKQVGDVVEIVVVRDAKEMALTVTLGVRGG